MIRLERIVDALPPALGALRLEARGQGFRMLDTLATEWVSGVQRFVHPGEALLAAYVGDELAGIGGITLEPTIPGALRMRRFYTALAYRHAGIGRALTEALLQQAAAKTITCNAAGGSEAFWESLGFVPQRRDGYTHRFAR